MSTGIDYSMGDPNVNRDPQDPTYHYGIISTNHEWLAEWFWDETEPHYPGPFCPHCGSGLTDDELNRCECDACESYYNETSDCYAEESDGSTLDTHDVTGFTDDRGDLWITKSLYYTRAAYCSPCAPGACHLHSPTPEGEKTYCLGPQWFKDGQAPYPVYLVRTGARIRAGLMCGLDHIRTEHGALPHFAWPGGYPLYYLTQDNCVCCADCANLNHGHDTVDHGEPEWNLVGYEVNWESPTLTCDLCNKRIESAYGDPETPDNEDVHPNQGPNPPDLPENE